MWLQKSYLFFIPPSIITNEIAIWRIRLNCCIIPEHSTNQIQKDKGKTNGKNIYFLKFRISIFIFIFSHTIPHLHSKQLELLCQWETFLDDPTCFLSPTWGKHKRTHMITRESEKAPTLPKTHDSVTKVNNGQYRSTQSDR